jgi:hypothetical protein
VPPKTGQLNGSGLKIGLLEMLMSCSVTSYSGYRTVPSGLQGKLPVGQLWQGVTFARLVCGAQSEANSVGLFALVAKGAGLGVLLEWSMIEVIWHRVSGAG